MRKEKRQKRKDKREKTKESLGIPLSSHSSLLFALLPGLAEVTAGGLLIATRNVDGVQPGRC
jgi:hypothetical protein